MTRKARLKLLQHKLKKVYNFYDTSICHRLEQLNAVEGFTPTILSEFASEYMAALHNVRKYGLKRVSANAYSGIPK